MDILTVKTNMRMMDDEQWLEFMLNLCDVRGVDPHMSAKWAVCRSCLQATDAELIAAMSRTLNPGER